VRRNIEFLLEHARPLAPVRWSPIDNLHITTKFIGEFPEERLPELKAAVAAMPKPAPFRLSVQGLGWFPNPHSPRVFLAGVRAPSALGEIASNLNLALEPLGVANENRPYQPHLTLARIPTPGNLLPLKQFVASLPSTDFGSMDVARILLYLSKPAAGGSVYSVIEEFPL
jgi:2'-5' RNA ligase